MANTPPKAPCTCCGRDTFHFLRYSGWAVGWFCDDHRPDKKNGLVKVSDIFELFGTGLPRPVLPLEWQDRRHPFSKLAHERVNAGTAEWSKINVIMMPRPPAEMNRAQRRRLQREKQ